MQDEQLKRQAVERLMGQENGQTEQNAYYARLNAAFPSKSEIPPKLPDLERMRQKIWQEGQDNRRRAMARRKYYMLAAAAMLVIGFGVTLLIRTNSSTTGEVAASSKPVTPGKPEKIVIADSLEVFVRAGNGMVQRREGVRIIFEAKEMSALFHFEPNDQLKKVEIRLPEGIFTIIGTEFILEGARGTGFLAVKSGTVSVRRDGREQLVRAGEFWSVRQNKVAQGRSGDNEKKLFADFALQGVDEAFFQHVQSPSTSQSKPVAAEKRISLILKSGSAVSGIFVSESREEIQLRIPATGNNLLQIKKSEIAQMNRGE